MPPTLVQATDRLRALREFRALPEEVEEVMEVLDEAFPPLGDRRSLTRFRYRVQAVLKVRDEQFGLLCRTVFLRDVNSWDAGFITDEPLPSGGVRKSAILEVAAPDGRTLFIGCELRRCREFLPGWYEGSVHFDHEEADFYLG